MENATKALLIGAGVLIAIVILSLVIFAYGRFSDFYGAQGRKASAEQLAAFNNEYASYDRDLTGFELVSLINKVVDFNEYKLDEGYEEMWVAVTISNDPSYANKGGLFDGLNGTPVIYKGKNSVSKKNDLKLKIETMQKLEKKYTAANLTKLVSNLGNFKPSVKGNDGQAYNSAGNEDKGKTIKDVLGKDYEQGKLPTYSDLLKYGDYLVFKRAEFKSKGAEYSSLGQIKSLTYEQQ